MKKNRAFTLVELIAVITIIAVIMLVSLPSLLGTLEKTNEKQYQDFLDNLYMMSENYVHAHAEEFAETDGPMEITIYQLREAEYFRTNPINPKTDKQALDSDKIIVTRNADNTYSYNFVGKE